MVTPPITKPAKTELMPPFSVAENTPKPSISINEAKTPEITGEVPLGWEIKPDQTQMIELSLSGMKVSAPVYKLVPKNAKYLVEPVGSKGMSVSLTKCIDAMNSTAKSLSVLSVAYSQAIASKKINQLAEPKIDEATFPSSSPVR